MSNTNTYLVNNIGHWQGLEEFLVGVHENQVQIDNDMTDGFETLQQEIEDLSVKATGVGMKDSGTTGEIFNTYSGDNANTAEAHASHAEGVSNHFIYIC